MKNGIYSANGGSATEASRFIHPESGRPRQLVLVIEDDPHDQEIYGRMLWYNGFDVIFANDGEAGIDAALQHSPDLILLDLELPKLHGLKVCQRLRGEVTTARTPIIALSAHAEKRMGARVAEAGCTVFLEKPASPVAVLHEVEARIGRAPAPGEEM
jgi:two-component system, cell cycle response regulator DivK